MPEVAISRPIALAEFEDGLEADCFAILLTKEPSRTKNDEPFLRCVFGAQNIKLPAMLWQNHRLYQEAGGWVVGQAYRLRARGEFKGKFGLQLQVLGARQATAELDGPDGFTFANLVTRSKYPQGTCLGRIREILDKYMRDDALRTLVLHILNTNEELFEIMPAAQTMHHGFTGGLVEHVWSVTRVSLILSNHYAQYYNDLNPPLNRDVILAGAILHDIGKLKELQYHPVEAKYTTTGTLIGHILMGRDLVRDTARELGGISDETLMLLEHCILSHHGKREFGSPVEPSTLEALILNFADELDAKFNSVACALQRCGDSAEAFTDKVFALNNRRFYRGAPPPPASGADEIDPDV